MLNACLFFQKKKFKNWRWRLMWQTEGLTSSPNSRCRLLQPTHNSRFYYRRKKYFRHFRSMSCHRHCNKFIWLSLKMLTECIRLTASVESSAIHEPPQVNQDFMGSKLTKLCWRSNKPQSSHKPFWRLWFQWHFKWNRENLHPKQFAHNL